MALSVRRCDAPNTPNRLVTVSASVALLRNRPVHRSGLSAASSALKSASAYGSSNASTITIVPEPPPAGTVPSCAEAGVMGALAGVLGSMMAMDALQRTLCAGVVPGRDYRELHLEAHRLIGVLLVANAPHPYDDDDRRHAAQVAEADLP